MTELTSERRAYYEDSRGDKIACLQYQKANSKVNTVKNYKFVLGKFGNVYNDREMDSITIEDVLSFLTGLFDGRKQTLT